MSDEPLIHLHQFLEMMSAERKATRSTLSAYDTDIRDFYKFLKGKRAHAVASQDIQNYLATQEHLLPSTRARRLSSLRQFYTFLIRTGKTSENPLACIQVFPSKSKHPHSVSEEDVAYLLQGAKTWDSAEGKRLSALLQLLYVSDISVNDLVSLPITVGLEAVKGEKSFLTQQGQVLESLQAYMRVRGNFLKSNQESTWLFPSSSQKGHITRQRFGQLVKELSLRVGRDPTYFSLYTIRRGFRKINQFERNFLNNEKRQ